MGGGRVAIATAGGTASVRKSRDLYVPPGDSSFWQGAFHDGDPEELERFARTIDQREGFTLELLYGDHEGGQRTIAVLCRAVRRRPRSEQLAHERHASLEPRPR